MTKKACWQCSPIRSATPPAKPPPKRKRAPPKKIGPQPTADESGDLEVAANQRIAALEAANPCSAFAPTPRPVRSRPTQRSTTTRKDISALVAEQRCATAQEGAERVSHSESDGDTDDEEAGQGPVKKARTVVIPDPETPAPALPRKLTAKQKLEAANAKRVAKAAAEADKAQAALAREAKRQAKNNEKVARKAEKERDAEEKRKKKIEEKIRKAQERLNKVMSAAETSTGKDPSTLTTGVAEVAGTQAQAAAQATRRGVGVEGRNRQVIGGTLTETLTEVSQHSNMEPITWLTCGQRPALNSLQLQKKGKDPTTCVSSVHLSCLATKNTNLTFNLVIIVPKPPLSSMVVVSTLSGPPHVC